MSREAATPRQLRALVEAWDGVDDFHRNVIADWLEEAGWGHSAERVRKMGPAPRFPSGQEVTDFVGYALAPAAGLRLWPSTTAASASPHLLPAGGVALTYLEGPSPVASHLCPTRYDRSVATAFGGAFADSAFVITHTPLRRSWWEHPREPMEIGEIRFPYWPAEWGNRLTFLAGQCETCPKAWWHWDQWEEVRTRQRRGYIYGLRE